MRSGEARPSTRERVAGIAQDILTAFESGELPKALARLFIHRQVEAPSKHWTWTNRLIAIRKGHVYAAGFRQWQTLGRTVKRGEYAIHILAPRITKATEDDEARGVKEGDPLTLGFLAVPVFGLHQTEGKPLPGAEEVPEFIDRLPLIEVARAWGLSVSTYAFDDAPDRAGFYTLGRGIALGVEDLSTWAHELMHAADDRLGNPMQPKVAAEVVADFGSAILLEALGYSTESDRGGVYAYLLGFCKREKQSLLRACTALLDRTCAGVAFLLDEADALAVTGGSGQTAVGLEASA
jgi:hypothetical protein